MTPSNQLVFLISIVQVFPSLSIIGGEIATNYPFFVLVLRGQNRCGGTIISKGAVLTAAHCLYNQEESRWAKRQEIFVFRGDFSTPNQWKGNSIAVRNYVLNSLYNRDSYDLPANFDMALLRLARSSKALRLENSILPICKQPSRNVLQSGIFIGLGLVDEPRPKLSLPRQLMEANMLRDESCGSFSRMGVSIDNLRQLCYIGVNGAFICQGDSGGPIVYKTNDKVACLIGISSFFDNNCTNPERPAVFTSAAVLRAWVRRKVNLDLLDLDFL